MKNKLLQCVHYFCRPMFKMIAVILMLNIGIFVAAYLCGVQNFAWYIVLFLCLNGGLLAYWVWRKWTMIMRGGALVQGMQNTDGEAAGKKLEIAVLKETMQDAIAKLSTSQIGMRCRGKAALYALPWFVVIGPAAAGKSTLLRNSGLHFVLNQEDDISVKGFGGTRHCDWWFSNQAVILDTAGRYTTEEADKPEWMTFLQMLKRHRKRRPIDGVLVAMDIADLLCGTAKSIQWHVQIIRQRITELTQCFGQAVPIHLMFTKCDLLSGFQEFFNVLHDSERMQTFGICCTGQEPPETLANRLDDLVGYLFAQQSRQLAIVYDDQLRQYIYDFPQQYYWAVQRIKYFFTLLCEANPYQDMPRWKGLYFSSAEQNKQIKIMQRIRADAQGNFHPVLSKNNGVVTESIPYFIQETLCEHVFVACKQVKLVSRKFYTEKTLKIILPIMTGLVVAAWIVWLQAALHKNMALLQAGEEVAYYSHVRQWYDFWDTLKTEHGGIPAYLRLGLYRGNRLLPLFSYRMVHMVQSDFIPGVSAYLTQKLRQYESQWEMSEQADREKMRGAYYAMLKAYLMLSQPQHVDLRAAALYVAYWSQLKEGKRYAGENIEQHMLQGGRLVGAVKLYLTQLAKYPQNARYLKPLQSDGLLVSQARKQLSATDDVKNVFDYEMQLLSLTLPDQHIEDLMPTKDAIFLSSNRALAGMYTRKFWEKNVRHTLEKSALQIKRGDWVIYGDGDMQSEHARIHTLSELYAMYFKAYHAAWITFLQSVQVRSFNHLEHAVQQLRHIASKAGPIVQWMQIVRYNMCLKEGEAHTDWQLPLQNIQVYLRTVEHLRLAIQKLALSPDVSQACAQYAQALLQGKGGHLALSRDYIAITLYLDTMTNDDMRTALRPLLLSPVREAWRVVVGQAVQQVEPLWQQQVYAFYERKIANAFPYASVTTEVEPEDFQHFFLPKEGILWTFVHAYLKPYLIYQQGKWLPRTWMGIGAGFSKNFLEALTQAEWLSRHLFSENPESQMQLRLQWYPEPLPGVSQVRISLNGKAYSYTNGPQEWMNMPCVINGADSRMRMEAAMVGGKCMNIFSGRGAWSVLRWVRSANVQARGDGSYILQWKKLQIRMRNEGVHDVLGSLLWNRVLLPQYVFRGSSGLMV